MYQSYFGMQRRPFGAAAQLEAYFPASGQEEALATLRYCITQGRGIALLTAPPGTGKTLVCRRLISSLEPAFTAALVTHTNLTSAKALLQAILHHLALPYRSMDEQELRLTLIDFLRGQYAGGTRTVLVIDEAQNLGIPVFEEVRMLGNLEGNVGQVVQTVLVGQPRLAGLLRQPELSALNQRIGTRASLGALNDEETLGYIRHQLQWAGVSPDKVFTQDAMAAVYEATGGIPRLINQLCEHAMLFAFLLEAPRVDQQVVEQASTDLNQASEPDASEIAVQLNPALRMQQPDHGEFQEIIVEDLLQSEPAMDNRSSTKNTAPVENSHPLDEVFDQEEVIVDQYAMMDAARAARPSARRPARKVDPVTVIARPTVPPTSEAQGQSSLPDTIPIGEVSTALVDGQAAEPAFGISPAFVEPADQPAVYEVGAGVEQEPMSGSEPDILVIENRSKRVAGNRGRVDVPRPAAKPTTGAYRRLFTQARKT